ncbi:TIGR02680 family protein [Actinoalloteichus sp. GBA129-24]|uniref:TIGR02680 family protein n=1 Tax=Actinoalloteichus sp. GBA129-24 TaxID=1612551 RepID=UPI000950B055|nr:TIGR02680 family protein [Actinoalloteichus sp. GBA129-24]APU22560.1 putative TIGR02680 family protein [Actinoalloteichus sp. GBA129-24]
MTVTELSRHSAPTPPEQSPRWTPSRAGILNVWRYYDEVFEFHHGKLLLRGQNGSGKSKALELLLPFLFDASLRANRLSTFGTGERTMHWNLMGEGASGTTRVGYVWLEFQFPGDPDRWFTCGARLQASSHTSTVHPDFFTTEQRIGFSDGLDLVTESGQPLTRSALEERLGAAGTLHDNARDYRAAVRSALFPTLSEQRYDALILALLQLRTPKLSQRLDPSLLSVLLSRALPPLGQQEIADLAEGFERLDRQRERLVTLDEEVRATRLLANRQRAYAQRVLRASAAVVISSTSELTTLTRTARESAEEYDRVLAAQQDAEAGAETLRTDIADSEERVTGIKESEEFQQGRALDRLREQSAEAAETAKKISEDARQKRTTSDNDAGDVRAAEKICTQHENTVLARATEALHAANRAGLTSVHGEIGGLADVDAARSRTLLRAAVNSRREQISEVRQALGGHGQAVDLRRRAEDDLEKANTGLAEARTRHETAVEGHETALTRLEERLIGWAASCRELAFPDPHAVLALTESEPALLAFVDAVAAEVLHEITRQETTAEAARTAVLDRRDVVTDEVRRLGAEQDLPPDPPFTRTADRAAMIGAPFWRLIDFAATTPEAAHAPIEAALRASGLLDAWVSPTGSVAGHDAVVDSVEVGHDVFARSAGVPPAPGRSLADVLVVEADTDVPVEAVHRLLAAVAYGESLPPGHPAAIGADGRWRLGSLEGSWHQQHPTYIGAQARERARRLRIDELTAEIEELDGAITAFDVQLTALHTRREVITAERAARPDHRELTEAAAALTRTVAEVAAADTMVGDRKQEVSERAKDVSRALAVLTGLAARHGLPTAVAALEALSDAVDAFRDTAENWLDGVGDLTSARSEARGLTTQAERSREIAEQREAEAAEAEEKRLRLVARLEAVESTIGADYGEILAELDRLRHRLGALRTELASNGTKIKQQARRLGELDTKRTTDENARVAASATRDAAVHRFRHLATGVFTADSGIDDLPRFTATLGASEGVRAALDAARLIAAAWPNLPHAPKNLGDAQQLLSESVHQSRSALSARADLDLEADEDVVVLTAVADGVRVGAAELLGILRADAERSRAEITERERELFDQTLTGDTRRHLAARIRQATELVDGMNARLERVRTASRVAVRLVWEVAPDLPPGTRAARDLLLKDPVRLTDADRDSLHRFFRERVEQAKTEDTSASWEQQLARVFDYTSWHRFVVKVDRANGTGWQLLTKKLHGALSGGEKAIALHLPLFAAVAAHYQVVPQAPRVILLDEVFVGVDSTNRGQVFALLSALDLDLMLTSDHEWCTYPELGGIAIHQLITGDGDDDAVTTARFTWNGHELSVNAEGD